MLRMAGVVDLAYWANIPLTVDVDVSEVMAFETRLMIARMVVGEWSINWYIVNGSCGINLMMEFSALEGQLDFGGEWRGGSGWKRLGVGRCSQFLDILL